MGGKLVGSIAVQSIPPAGRVDRQCVEKAGLFPTGVWRDQNNEDLVALMPCKASPCGMRQPRWCEDESIKKMQAFFLRGVCVPTL